MKNNVERLTLECITRDSLLAPADKKVVIGVSGGPDSVALLHVLVSLQDVLQISIVTVYVDHGLRPDEIKAEKKYVSELSRRLKTDFVAVDVDVRAFAAREKVSLEHGARELRYQALRGVAREKNATLVAVAHTADDQAEEVLLRLFRAGGRKALSGMRTRSGDIIRPFLRLGKDAILTYLEEKEIHYCVDSSNADKRFLRNRVRLRLLPYLEQNFDRGIRRALCKTADTLAEDEALLEELTERAMDGVVVRVSSDEKSASGCIVLDRKELVKRHPALQRRIIEKLLWQIGGRASYIHILTILEAARNARTGTEHHLSKGLRVGVLRENLELVFPRGCGPWRGRLYPGK